MKLYIPYFSLRELLGKENSITVGKKIIQLLPIEMF